MLGRFVTASTFVLVALVSAVPMAAAAPATERVRVIVAFEDAVQSVADEARALGRRYGFTVRHVYGTALRGFSATVPARAVSALAAHPKVAAVEVDTLQSTAEQSVPTGIDRIETDKNPSITTTGAGVTVNVPIAVLDTGIDPHPDLNLAGGYGATGQGWNDYAGHGTHVAGTVAARDNGQGVVGVAPGAPVWSVRVCMETGCWYSDIVEGIDWVAARKSDFKRGRSTGINFGAANYSITSADSSRNCRRPADVVHRAICGLVNQGVVFVMAAGNDARQKTAYPVAFTVASVADFDGRAGGIGAQTCWGGSEADDTLSDFSNWGVDIAAPGTCINSTYKGGGYATMNGTSMATPHVTGAVALYLHATKRAPATSTSGVTSIESAIRNAALSQSHACGYRNERGSSEKLLFVNASTFAGSGACE
jgi:subtilisin family serine protease